MSKATFFVEEEQGAAILEDVALKIFTAWDIRDWEERFSANYPPDEHYFAGYTANAEVTVMDCDTETLACYPFCIQVEKPSWRTGSGELATDPVALAQLLAAAGLTIFIPRGAWFRKDWDGAGESYPAKLPPFGVS